MESTEKIEVYYSFSPLLGRMHFDKVSQKAHALGVMFPELTVSCRDHWPDHRDTIQIMGMVDANQSDIFLTHIEELQNLAEAKS